MMMNIFDAQQHREFEDRGRRWALCMLHRLKEHWLDIPLVWPGTREQADTIVHAFTTDVLSESDRAHLVEVVQNGARLAWSELIRTSMVAARTERRVSA